MEVENDEETDTDNVTLDKQLTNMISGKLCLPTNTQNQSLGREVINAIAKKIQTLKLQYNVVIKLGKDYKCYARSCNVSPPQSTNQPGFIAHTCSCYSPLCMQRARIRKELFLLLRKANIQFNNSTSLIKPATNTVNAVVSTAATPIRKPSILEQKLTAPKITSVASVNRVTAHNVEKSLETAVACATKCDDDLKNVFVPKKALIKNYEEDKEVDVCKMEDDVIKSPPSKRQKRDRVSTGESSKTKNETDGAVVTTNQITTTTTTTTTQTVKTVDGKVKSLECSESKTDQQVEVSTTINGSGKTIQTLNAKSSASTYSAQQNRRFCLKTVKREEKVLKAEHAEDGSERVYSTVSSEGKVYLKKVQVTHADRKKKRIPVKYPLCSTFQTRKGIRSIMVLPQHEMRKLARHAGRISIHGFHAMAKPNPSVWPYPCCRPLFKTCWLYRTVNLRSLAAAALQLRILWACLRWDDMQIKPLTSDGKHQITTDTDIITMEMLKHRHIGRFLERTQYLRRKVVIPLELPKTVRGKNCITNISLISIFGKQ